jgi:hypothetical protein
MINDFDYLEFDSYEFENDDLLPFEENSKAHKAAKKDIEKVIVPDPDEEIEQELNDDFAKDWIEITDDDDDDDDQ